MTNDQIDHWATLLTDYCLAVQPGETVLLAADLPARSLVEAVYRAIVLRGAHPLVRVDLPGLAEHFLEHATEAQLRHCPPIALYEAQNIDARLRIVAETDTRALARIDPSRQAMLDRARHPIREASRHARWALTQFPTPAYADDAGMGLDEYTSFAASAMFLDQPDPAACWRELGRRQAGLIEFLQGVDQVRIEAPGTDITLSVANRVWINSDGRRNMPSGEVFTGPVETTPSGRLRCAFPVCRGGRRLTGIELTFEDGRVTHAHADEGEDYLRAMLDLDPGARRLGEIGIGLNPGIQRFTGSILYDEKIGGTIHLALGSSYPETGGLNQSALHWDLIIDTRDGGRVTADGRTVMENGRWLVG
jgi:aminopeptidase